EIVFSYLLDNNINVNRQVSIKKIKINNNIIDNSYSNRLLFDFYFIYNNITHCIEYDGELHFDKNALSGYIQRKSNKILDSQTINNIFLNYRNNDIQKTNFCKKYKIKLLRIHYSQQSNISQLIDIFINSDYTDRFNPYISNIDYYKEIV
ncbi:MAG TPA: hypothetical protein PK891_05955, partial [Bacteroidales bacterium]|nr:hypothetical protein [Bacteroidales bacterium]